MRLAIGPEFPNAPPKGALLAAAAACCRLLGLHPADGGHPPTHHSTLPPPPGYFLTKIFHPNVSASGEICVNVLKRDWAPDLGLRHVLTVIRCLLIEPNAESGAAGARR